MTQTNEPNKKEVLEWWEQVAERMIEDKIKLRSDEQRIVKKETIQDEA